MSDGGSCWTNPKRDAAHHPDLPLTARPLMRARSVRHAVRPGRGARRRRALHQRIGGRVILEHLIKGMNQLDRSSNGTIVPRFVGYPDNRDFFSVVERRQEVGP